MSTKSFTLHDQRAFAELSGDYNPLHLDPVAARRSMTGGCVVHGMHLLLWALDEWLSDQPLSNAGISIKAQFQRPSPIDLPLELEFAARSHEALKVRVRAGAADFARFSARRSTARMADSQPMIGSESPKRYAPCELTEREIGRCQGHEQLTYDRQACADQFPHVTRHMTAEQIAALLGYTRVVGMQCPGLHSLLSEMTLADDPGENSGGLSYSVTEFDDRFGLAVLAMRTQNTLGTVKAFLRPPPRAQPAFSELQSRVVADEFSGQRALVVGGSRGIGEVTAKLLAAGGANVVVTYHAGQHDAQRVVDEINAAMPVASCCQLDVLNPPLQLPIELSAECGPTHIYYFATPFIFSAIERYFSPALFERFSRYYVTGFVNLLDRMRNRTPLSVFAPSSTALDERPLNMGEYAAAKAAAESVCAYLRLAHPRDVYLDPRLPRMDTDQTASLLQVDSQDAAELMLNHLRTLSRLSTEKNSPS